MRSRALIRLRWLLVAVAASALGVGPIADARTTGTDRTQPVERLDVLSGQIVAEINAVRSAHQVRRLRIVRPLTRAAGSHTRSMAAHGFFGHETPSGVTFGQRIRRYYPGSSRYAWTAGENLLATTGPIDARSVVEAWLASPSHRDVLLTRSWREIGVTAIHAPSPQGVFGGRSTVLVAAEFGLRRR